jgi:hypothetical protein
MEMGCSMQMFGNTDSIDYRGWTSEVITRPDDYVCQSYDSAHVERGAFIISTSYGCPGTVLFVKKDGVSYMLPRRITVRRFIAKYWP